MILLKSYNGDETKNLRNRLIDTLNSINKYSVLPVYILQFLVNKETLDIFPVLVAYDDKAFVVEAASSNPYLEEVIHEKLPKAAYPTAIAWSEEIGITYPDLLSYKNESYYYADSFLVAGKELKDLLRKGELVITQASVVSDNLKTQVKIQVDWMYHPLEIDELNPVPEQKDKLVIMRVPDGVKTLHLPFSNYTERAKSYIPLINKVLNKEFFTFEEAKDIAEIYDGVKENQTHALYGDVVFKDFIKVKPTSLIVTGVSEEAYFNTSVRSTYLHMYFKSSKSNVILMYRYFERVVDSILGRYEEEQDGQAISE